MKHTLTFSEHEPTMKQLWLAAFTNLLCHMAPDDAIVAADRALHLCNEAWKNPEWVHTWQYKHNYPVGYQFAHADSGTPATPENDDYNG
ncbi:hypothetical protein [Xanthomonas sp. NCPPB 2632]|uniref:hypothetical protein n=1 Tax=Xanthomonas sp. NCPPB 2632 TaxID=3240912 RepID=UPI0035142821